jgi:hypothetical protein
MVDPSDTIGTSREETHVRERFGGGATAMTAVEPRLVTVGARLLRGTRLPWLAAGGVSAMTLALRVRDPHVSGSWGYCPFLVLTGRACPACGGLRAVNDLTHGDVVGALSSNALVVALIPIAVWFWLQWVRAAAGRRPPLGTGPVRMWIVWGSLGLGVAFAVVRNLPFGAWLAP